ncbi:MAG: N-acetyltransferase [Caldilineae bacterium]|nr:MAG: N-acetyltransferase [Caldilineae bacterium]
MIHVSPLNQEDIPALTALFNHATAHLPYRWELDAQSFRELVLEDDGEPWALLSPELAGCLVARYGEEIIGFAHCAIGYLAGERDNRRRGFLRFLITASDAPAWTANLLLAETETYFRERRIGEVEAFHIHTGYRCLLAGRGALPDQRLDLMQALGEAGYRMCSRWLLYERMIYTHTRELLPRLDRLSLQIEPSEPGFALHAARQAEPVADFAVRYLPLLSQRSGLESASLEHLRVHEPFRRQGVARWLALRGINELASRGFSRLIVHINHNELAAQSLLLSLGFDELPLRAYSYTKNIPLSA